MQVVYARNRMLIVTGDQISLLETSFQSRAFGFERDDQHSGLDIQLEMAHHPSMKRNDLARDSDVATAHAAFFDQLAGDELRGIDRDGETKSLCRKYDSRVDADYLAARIGERATGISRIQGGIGLNDVVDRTA